jgi:hypothetical protein
MGEPSTRKSPTTKKSIKHFKITYENGPFTLYDIKELILDFESLYRPKSYFINGPDLQHIVFGGFDKQKDGSYLLEWEILPAVW